MMQEISVKLATNIVSVHGAVNDKDYTFTLQSVDGGTSTWTAMVEKATPDIYRCTITATDSAGESAVYSTTLYYGLNLITDRSQADVNRVKQLNALGFDSWTDSEVMEYLNNSKGAYNADDLNRVESAVAYLIDRFHKVGFDITLPIKNTWVRTEYMSVSDTLRYLNNIKILRNLIPVPQETPEVPSDMVSFTYEEANNIERILEIVDRLITNIELQFHYSGEIFAGEVL